MREFDWQVCSPELAQRLRDLGITQESEFVWVWWKYWEWRSSGAKPTWEPSSEDRYFLRNRYERNDPMYMYWDKSRDTAAFTVAELGEILIRFREPLPFYNGKKWVVPFSGVSVSESFHDTEANARATEIIYLIKIGAIKL